MLRFFLFAERWWRHELGPYLGHELLVGISEESRNTTLHNRREPRVRWSPCSPLPVPCPRFVFRRSFSPFSSWVGQENLCFAPQIYVHSTCTYGFPASRTWDSALRTLENISDTVAKSTREPVLPLNPLLLLKPRASAPGFFSPCCPSHWKTDCSSVSFPEKGGWSPPPSSIPMHPLHAGQPHTPFGNCTLLLSNNSVVLRE